MKYQKKNGKANENNPAEEEKIEEKKDEPKKKKKNVVIPPKDFDLNNLENLWTDTGKIDKNKKEVVYTPIITNKQKVYSEVNINLKLLQDLEFSMTEFVKVNKGLANSNINCFMNVVLQSLIACPAFFNMLSAVSQS